DRGRYNELGFLELADGAGAAHAHGGAEGADQVLGAVVAAGGPKEDALEGAIDANRNAGAARELRVRRGHAPVVTASGRFLRAGKNRSEHDRVGAGNYCLTEIARLLDAAVGDDRDVAAGLAIEVVAGGGALDGRAHLGNADAQHL